MDNEQLTGFLTIPAGDVNLAGDFVMPPDAKGIVLFVHGSDSSRHSSRNKYVARVLQQAGIATLLFDLLTEEEEAIDIRTRHLRFDIELLSRRLVQVTQWIRRQQQHRQLQHSAQAGHSPQGQLKIGYFGASTGGAAALVAAAELGNAVSAVVSRGGRPDLAGSALPQVLAPTLLLVGGWDTPVIEMNRDAFEQLHCEKAMKIIPGASHLFEEPGKLEEVARLSAEWFVQHLSPHSTR